jgi:hypothetical protein
MLVPRIESSASDESGPPPAPTPRQFSLRKLFLVTAVVSIVLALVVNPPPWIFAVLVAALSLAIVGIVPGAALLLAFVTSHERPRLATVSWMLFGVLLLAGTVDSLITREFGAAIAWLVSGTICLFRARTALLLVLNRND